MHVNFNVRNRQNRSVLMLAASGGGLDFVRFLLEEAGVDPDGVDLLGNGALHYAVMHGHAAVVAELLRGGANVNLANSQEMQPIHLAAEQDEPGVAAALAGPLLIPDAVGGHRQENAAVMAIRNGNAVVLEELLGLGVPVGMRVGAGNSLAHMAASMRSLPCLKLLHGARLGFGSKNDAGDTVFHVLARNGFTAGAKWAVDRVYSGHLNARNECGHTALAEAVLADEYGVFAALWTKKPDFLRPDLEGECALSHAILRGRRNMVVDMMESVTNPELQIGPHGGVLHYGVLSSDVGMIELLWRLGAKPDVVVPGFGSAKGFAEGYGYAGAKQELDRFC